MAAKYVYSRKHSFHAIFVQVGTGQTSCKLDFWLSIIWDIGDEIHDDGDDIGDDLDGGGNDGGCGNAL